MSRRNKRNRKSEQSTQEIITKPSEQPIVIVIETIAPTVAPIVTPPKPKIPKINPLKDVPEEMMVGVMSIGNALSGVRHPMRKSEVEQFVNQNHQIQMLANYSKHGFYMDIYYIGKKIARFPFTGEYPLYGG